MRQDQTRICTVWIGLWMFRLPSSWWRWRFGLRLSIIPVCGSITVYPLDPRRRMPPWLLRACATRLMILQIYIHTSIHPSSTGQWDARPHPLLRFTSGTIHTYARAMLPALPGLSLWLSTEEQNRRFARFKLQQPKWSIFGGETFAWRLPHSDNLRNPERLQSELTILCRAWQWPVYARF